MTGYIYNIDTRETLAELISENQDLISTIAEQYGADAETVGLTYSPAYGATDGLIDMNAPQYDLDAGELPAQAF